MTRESEVGGSRRRFLRLSAAAATALSGCFTTDGQSTPPSDGSSGGTPMGRRSERRRPGSPRREEFETVVDAVADAGVDRESGESILPFLEEYADDDTLLYFPPGTYLMDDLWEITGVSNLGIVGENATIVPPVGYDDYLFAVGSKDQPASEFSFEGVRFDFRNPRTTPRPIQVVVDDGLLVRDVEVRGSTRKARFDVTNENGSGLVERLRLPGGGPDGSGCFVGPITTGKLTFRDCYVEGFPGNGLYASAPEGPIHVIGGSYRNNGIANVRVSGGSVVRGVHVRCDEAPNGFENMRGIRLRNGKSALVENCTIEMMEVTYSDGAIVVESRMQSAVIRDTDVRISADRVAALKAKSPKPKVQNSSHPPIRCENLWVTGDGSNYSTVRIADRDGSQLNGLTVSQTGENMDGIHLIRASETTVQDASIQVSGDPLVLEQSSVNLQDVKFKNGQSNVGSQ